MKMQQFSGTGVALITPFRDYKVDFDALERIIEHCISGGVDYLVSLGTTGEAITLTGAECREVLDFTIKVNAGRLPVVAGLFGRNNTSYLVEATKSYNFEGIDAILSSSPAYNKPTQEGIFQHYMALAEVSPRPIIIYNVPGRTSSNMEANTLVRLAKASDKFIAVKEASGNLVQGAKVIKHKPDDFMVLSGDDPTALPLISCGGEGVISVIANVFPAQFSDMIRSAMNGDFATASALHLQMLDVHQWLYVEGNPTGIKAAMEIQGFCSRETRLPLTPMSGPNYTRLKAEMQRMLVNTQAQG
ncbi:MAG: 4-hydroxy-tetrahydrodipicolinate synthase [Bacteroidota bacterium]